MGLLQPSNGSASAAAAVCRAYRWMVVDALGGSQQRRLTQDTCTYTLVLVLAVAGAQSALHNTLAAYLPVDHDIAAYPLGGLCSLSAGVSGQTQATHRASRASVSSPSPLPSPRTATADGRSAPQLIWAEAA